MPKQGILTALTASVHRILTENWDPIGVYTPGGDWPDDEYHGYVPGVVGLLVHGAEERRIADHLERLASASMGLSPSVQQTDLARRAAALLVAEGRRILGEGGV